VSCSFLALVLASIFADWALTRFNGKNLPLTLGQTGHLYEVIQPILTRAMRIIASQC
jgi:hypothetical protein